MFHSRVLCRCARGRSVRRHGRRDRCPNPGRGVRLSRRSNRTYRCAILTGAILTGTRRRVCARCQAHCRRRPHRSRPRVIGVARITRCARNPVRAFLIYGPGNVAQPRLGKGNSRDEGRGPVSMGTKGSDERRVQRREAAERSVTVGTRTGECGY